MHTHTHTHTCRRQIIKDKYKLCYVGIWWTTIDLSHDLITPIMTWPRSCSQVARTDSIKWPVLSPWSSNWSYASVLSTTSGVWRTDDPMRLILIPRDTATHTSPVIVSICIQDIYIYIYIYMYCSYFVRFFNQHRLDFSVWPWADHSCACTNIH